MRLEEQIDRDATQSLSITEEAEEAEEAEETEEADMSTELYGGGHKRRSRKRRSTRRRSRKGRSTRRRSIKRRSTRRRYL